MTCLNLPSCEIKNQLTFYKARWFKYNFRGPANILLHIPLEIGKKMKKILIPPNYLKL